MVADMTRLATSEFWTQRMETNDGCEKGYTRWLTVISGTRRGEKNDGFGRARLCDLIPNLGHSAGKLTAVADRAP